MKGRAKAGDDLRAVLESELEGNVIELAQLLGYKCAHFRPAMLPSGRWATHMRGDKGFPDLVLAKRGRLIFAELKRSGEEATPEQLRWLEVLGSVPGVVAVVWSTEDWVSGAIEEELRRAPARPPRRRRKAAMIGGETVVLLEGPRGGLSPAVVLAGPGVQRRVLG